MASTRTLPLVLLLSACALLVAHLCPAANCRETTEREDVAPASNAPHLKQSGLWPAFLWPVKQREKPNVFLIGIKPYQSMLPKPVQDAIEQQIRPQTDELSAQILSNVPGAEQMYQQVSDFMDMFSSFGPASLLGGGGGSGNSSGSSLSGLMGGLSGRRR